MKRGVLFILAGLGLAIVGCSSGNTTQKVEPQARGQRGESCQARNDCAAGLACIHNVCSRNDFNIAPKAKMCDKVDCQKDADCCGTQPTSVPAKCQKYDQVCLPEVPGCTSGGSCTSDSDCKGGTCGSGYCSNYSSQSCTADSDCANTCDTTYGQCSLTFNSCTTDADCQQGTCGSRTCSCYNPNYNSSDPICSDPDCTTPPCTYKCESERCVENTSCKTDADCIVPPLLTCNNGQCVECVKNADCNQAAGEQCIQGACKKPCTVNEECPLFQKCDTKSGQCVETGCTSDTECILAMSQDQTSTSDARLAKCLPSDADPTKKQCKIPCENDGACSQFEVCVSGYCKFIGCSTDEECRAYFGLADQVPTDTHPWVTRAVCRAPTSSP